MSSPPPPAPLTHVHYAVQTCDVAFNQVAQRYCNTDKATVVRKCVTSFFAAVLGAAQRDRAVQHVVCVIDDRSSPDTVAYLRRLVRAYTRDNVTAAFVPLAAVTHQTGVMASIRATYEWLRDHGQDLVYQVQDDYLFHPDAVVELLDAYAQLRAEHGTQPVLSPWNRAALWRRPVGEGGYRGWASPRMVTVGRARYWIQMYDTSCSFLTHVEQLRRQWDLIEAFLALPPRGLPPDGRLESVSLNLMFTKREVLGMMPVDSLALHVQAEEDKDPHVDWREWWGWVREVEVEG
jgi:hypothetical protein